MKKNPILIYFFDLSITLSSQESLFTHPKMGEFLQ